MVPPELTVLLVVMRRWGSSGGRLSRHAGLLSLHPVHEFGCVDHVAIVEAGANHVDVVAASHLEAQAPPVHGDELDLRRDMHADGRRRAVAQIDMHAKGLLAVSEM